MSVVSLKRSKFSPEFKKQMVELYLEQRASKTLAQVARENGVGVETLRNWVKKYRDENPDAEPPLTVSERARLAELERENRELKLEREFLEKRRPSSPRSIGEREVLVHRRAEGHTQYRWQPAVHGQAHVRLAGGLDLGVL